MPIPLDPAIIVEKNRKDQSGWCWIADIDLGAAQKLYATNNNKVVEWNGFTYVPLAEFSVGPITMDATGTAASRTLTLSNVDRRIGSELVKARGLAGRSVVLREVCPAYIGNPDALAYEGFFTIRSCEGDLEVVTLTLSLEDIGQHVFPRGRMHKSCPRVLGGAGCGYDIVNGALKTCSQTLQGDNGCEAHGEEERTRGVQVLHPLRFRGFLGLPRR